MKKIRIYKAKVKVIKLSLLSKAQEKYYKENFKKNKLKKIEKINSM